MEISKRAILIPSLIADENSPLPEWVVEFVNAVKCTDFPLSSDPEGNYVIELVGGIETTITQLVCTMPGKSWLCTGFILGFVGHPGIAGKETVKVGYES